MSSAKEPDMKFSNLKYDGAPFIPPMWVGTKVGILKVESASSNKNMLHFCYINLGEYNEGYTPSRVSNYFLSTSAFNVTVLNPGTTSYNYLQPEMQSFFVEYAGTVEPTNTVSFTFAPGSNF